METITKKKIFFIFLFFIIISSVFFVKIEVVLAGKEHNVWGWAWTEIYGWISFNSINCDYDGDGQYEGVDEGLPSESIISYCPAIGTPNPPSFCDFDGDNIYEGGDEGARPGCPVSATVYSYGISIGNVVPGNYSYFSGYIWSENIGWIRMDPSGPYPDFPDSSVRVFISDPFPPSGDPSSVEGWARACLVYKDDVVKYGVDCKCGDVCQELKPNSERDGWEGWINFNSEDWGGGFYKVILDSLSPLPYPFTGWAWGGNASFATAPDYYNGIGWISMNCENTSSCGGIDYKVWTDLVVPNQPPYADLLKLTAKPDYCYGQGRGHISLGWTYNDSDGDIQEYYHLQISNVNFSDPGFIEDFIDDGGSLFINKIAYSPAIGGEGSSQAITTIGVPNPNDFEMPYREVAYWRVRVMADQGGSGNCYNLGTCDETTWAGCPADCISDWAVYDGTHDVPPDPDGDNNGIANNTFTTPDSAYPYPDFTYEPLYPKIEEEITFSDNSKCYDVFDNECFCKNQIGCVGISGDNIFYEWDFDDSDGVWWDYIYQANPGDDEVYYTYDERGNLVVTLQVRDDYYPPGSVGGERMCHIDKSFKVKLPVPQWKETMPF